MKQTRRVILTGFMTVFFFRFLPAILVQGQETESVNIQWRVPREQVKNVRENLNFDGEIKGDQSTIEDTKGLPLIYIFAGVVAVGQLSRTLLEVYRDVRYGGIIIHRKDEKIYIDNDPRFSSGTIVVIEGDEIKVFQDENQPQPTEIIDALKPLMNK